MNEAGSVILQKITFFAQKWVVFWWNKRDGTQDTLWFGFLLSESIKETCSYVFSWYQKILGYVYKRSIILWDSYDPYETQRKEKYMTTNIW